MEDYSPLIEKINNYNIDMFDYIEIHKHTFPNINEYFNYIIDKYYIDLDKVTVIVKYDRESKTTILEVWLTANCENNYDNIEAIKFYIKLHGNIFDISHDVMETVITSGFGNSISDDFIDRYKCLLRLYKINKLTA